MPVAAPLYPVGLIVEGRPVLVVGGGRVAARKVEGLVACGARVHVVAPVVSDAVRAAGVTWDERPFRPDDVDGHRLVFAATGDPSVDAAVHAAAEARDVWVNSADDPAHCTFTLPAVVRRGSVTVAVATGGNSPALSVWLRRRLEAELGPEYEVLVDLLAEARAALQATGRSSESVDWQMRLDEGILEMIRGGRVAEARERLNSW